MGATLFASLLETMPDLPYTKTILRPAKWPVVSVQRKTAQMHEFLAEGRVLTLAPIFPLEANLQIYPQLASGPFAWRTATFLGPTTQAAYHVVDPAHLEEFLQSDPPRAILTSFEHHEIELPMVTYAKAHGYLPHRLEERGTLWLPRK